MTTGKSTRATTSCNASEDKAFGAIVWKNTPRENPTKSTHPLAGDHNSESCATRTDHNSGSCATGGGEMVLSSFAKATEDILHSSPPAGASYAEWS